MAGRMQSRQKQSFIAEIQARLQNAKKPRVTSQVKGDPRMNALYRGWLMVLRQLKKKYHKASLRMVAPAKIKVSQKQRLPPTILSYMQKNKKTKTSNPLPKQTKVEPQTKTNNPVEPQMNIVQES